LNAIPDLTVPPGRTRKRFFAELLVFIFGIVFCPLTGSLICNRIAGGSNAALGCLLSLVSAAEAGPLQCCIPVLANMGTADSSTDLPRCTCMPQDDCRQKRNGPGPDRGM